MTGKIYSDNLHPDVLAKFFQPDGVSIVEENKVISVRRKGFLSVGHNSNITITDAPFV